MSMRPPVLARLLLRALLPARHREYILGDLDEEFAQRIPVDGRLRTVLWYWRQAAASLLSEARYDLAGAPTVTFGEPTRGSRLAALRQDIRYALRSLNRRPVFTTVAVITLALGIGANTAIFSIANWLLLRPIPGLARQHELVALEFGTPQTSVGISWLNLNDLKQTLSSFHGITGFTQVPLQLKSESAPARTVHASAVDGDYFEVLRVGIRQGRAIEERETRPGSGSTVAVISDRLWSELFARDPSVIGRTLQANKLILTVVGVVERGFQGVDRFGRTDVWVPYALYAQLRHMDEQAFYVRGTGMRFFNVVARLNPGVSQAMAQSELRRAMAALVLEYPAENEIYKKVQASARASVDMPQRLQERVQSTVLLLLIVVALLLVISSANVANMLLVRGLQKRPEAAIRRALGASASRLTLQTLSESIILALLGGAAGLLVLRVILALVEGGRIMYLPPIEHVPFDARVLAFALGTSLLTGLLFGLAPLSIVRRVNINAVLQSRSARVTGAASLARKGIAAAQIALSLALLAGTLVVTRTLNRLLEVDSGYDHERLAGFQIATEPQGYTLTSEVLLGERLLQKLRASPGVEAATLTRAIPFEPITAGFGVHDPLQRSEQGVDLQMQTVSDDYFRTLGLTILKGRAIEKRDWQNVSASEFNIMLSATAAHRLFGDGDALGRTITTRGKQPLTLHVVGVVRDASLNLLRDPVQEVAYLPFPAMARPGFVVLMRTRSAPASLESVARDALASVDPAIPLDFQTVSENIRGQVSTERFLSTLFLLFSALAVLLATIGLYGVMAAIVSERRREISIRMALGAPARRVLLLVSQESAYLVGLGVVFGLAGAYALNRGLGHVLSGMIQPDLLTYLFATLLFGIVAALATVLPARAATRLSPAMVLKQD